ncbi:MAG: hypothetical protein AB7P40_27765 [Chloroflexota bacterium]
MLQIAFVLVLAALWAATFNQPGGTDFIRVEAFRVGSTIIYLTDVLTGVMIVGLMVTMRGPLAITAAVLLALWMLTLVGIPRVMGVPLSPLIVFVIVVGASVHIVTHRT